jgi:hypothetical protein
MLAVPGQVGQKTQPVSFHEMTNKFHTPPRGRRVDMERVQKPAGRLRWKVEHPLPPPSPQVSIHGRQDVLQVPAKAPLVHPPRPLLLLPCLRLSHLTSHLR